MESLRIIKKYPNRRLYDTKLGTYITLDDLKKLVFERIQFQVIDARTKKDLTQSTLLQIIAEQEATSTSIFTASVLEDFIRFYNEKSQNMFGKYLEQALDLFHQQKEFMHAQWETYQNILINPMLFNPLKRPPEDPTHSPTSPPENGYKVKNKND